MQLIPQRTNQVRTDVLPFFKFWYFTIFDIFDILLYLIFVIFYFDIFDILITFLGPPYMKSSHFMQVRVSTSLQKHGEHLPEWPVCVIVPFSNLTRRWCQFPRYRKFQINISYHTSLYFIKFSSIICFLETIFTATSCWWCIRNSSAEVYRVDDWKHHWIQGTI